MSTLRNLNIEESHQIANLSETLQEEEYQNIICSISHLSLEIDNKLQNLSREFDYLKGVNKLLSKKIERLVDDFID